MNRDNTGKRRVDDELREYQHIHLLKMFMGHNQYAHGHNFKVMRETFVCMDQKNIWECWKCSPCVWMSNWSSFPIFCNTTKEILKTKFN